MSTLSPSVVGRLLGSLGGIIAALEEGDGGDDGDAAGNEGGAVPQQGRGTG